ncbi:MAG: Maf family protein, partial [Spirochaetota bacterium]
MASASPRRRELLDQMGVAHHVQEPQIDESERAGEGPIDLARRLAEEKCAAVRGGVSHRLVVAADTVVFLDDHLLAKPEDREDARRMLGILSGRTHAVVSAVAVFNRDSGETTVDIGITKVIFALLDDDEIEWYLDSDEWQGVAG